MTIVLQYGGPDQDAWIDYDPFLDDINVVNALCTAMSNLGFDALSPEEVGDAITPGEVDIKRIWLDGTRERPMEVVWDL